MRTFVRRDGRRIEEEGSSKRVTREFIRTLIESGVEVRYVDFDTRQDLMQNLYRGINKRNTSYHASESDLENGLGPVHPEFGDKKRKCGSCNALTVNRYKCSNCLELVSSRIDGDFIYYNSSGEYDEGGADE